LMESALTVALWSHYLTQKVTEKTK
jgi:hypothetical protein